MAQKVISGYTIRKLQTAVREAHKLEGGEKLAGRLEGILAEVEASSLALLKRKKPKGKVPIESRPQFMLWVRMYQNLVGRLSLPAIFGNEFRFWATWWKTDQLFTRAGQEAPWGDAAALEPAIRRETGFNASVCFEWLCNSRNGVPNIRGMMLRAKTTEKREDTGGEVRDDVRDVF